MSIEEFLDCEATVEEFGKLLIDLANLSWTGKRVSAHAFKAAMYFGQGSFPREFRRSRWSTKWLHLMGKYLVDGSKESLFPTGFDNPHESSIPE